MALCGVFAVVAAARLSSAAASNTAGAHVTFGVARSPERARTEGLTPLMHDHPPARNRRSVRARRGRVAAGPWLLVSDVHFTPFAGATKSLVGRLQRAPVRRWRTLLARTGRAPSRYGQDTNAALLNSSLAAMRRAVGRPPVVLVGGDLLAHEFFQTYAKLVTHPNRRGYRTFVGKTMAYLASRFDQTFPRAQFVLTLGNNDSYCGDYRGAPDSSFLADTARAWRPLVDRDGGAPGFVRSFSQLGSYVARLPRPHLSVVSVDDIFWTAGYKNACGSATAHPGAAEARWLGATMRRLPAGQRALILTHVPPGIDVYATLQGSGAPVPLLTSQGQKALLDALDAGHVAALVFGHLHMSTYRVDRGAPMLGMPSISPIDGNNPAFLTATIDRDGEITDYTAHVLGLRRAPPRWWREYSFDKAYGLPAFDAASLRRLGTLLVDNAKLRRAYEHFYVSDGKYPITPAQYPAYACGTTALQIRTFTACVKHHQSSG
jgi:hypothetical protein